MIKKIKVMSNVLKEIKNLKVGENIVITYNDKKYELKAYEGFKGEIDYSVWTIKGFGGMNVEKITSKYITLYDYNMMSQRSTYKMAVNKIKLG
jgi:hypothetical protein